MGEEARAEENVILIDERLTIFRRDYPKKIYIIAQCAFSFFQVINSSILLLLFGEHLAAAAI